MNIIFKDPGLKYSLNSIEMFQTEEQSEYWRESLFIFYPQLERARFDALDSTEQHTYLSDKLSEVYEKSKMTIKEKINDYQAYWNHNKEQVEDAFRDAFNTDVTGCFNDIVANITLNPICPRYLTEHSFDVFYLNSEKGALGMSLHEMIHFVWFMVWNQQFGDNYSEYETPNLKWLFSEIVVDSIMRDERLSSINPYSPNECIYDYFYNMTIDGKPIVETIYYMYSSLSIHEFMKQGFEFFIAHENEIRCQIK